MLHSPKRHVVSKVLTENKLFCFSKGTLCTGTACNKGLKQSLDIPAFLNFFCNSRGDCPSSLNAGRLTSDIFRTPKLNIQKRLIKLIKLACTDSEVKLAS